MAQRTTSKLPVDGGIAKSRRERQWRRGGTVALAVVLVFGLTGRLGVHTSTKRVMASEINTTLVYPDVTRPGLAVAWRLEVTGLGADVERLDVTLSADYLDSFDHNLVTPQPEKVSRTADVVTFQFNPAGAQSFEMSLDMRLEPGVQWRRKSETIVTLNGERLATFDYTTWVAP